MTENETNPPRPRNRSATETRILEAARVIIARDGFTALGVNAVAAEAGCDKKLITRYFGGIEGVVETLGGDLGFWVGPVPPVADPDASYADRMVELFIAYQTMLTQNDLLQRVLAAELDRPSAALLVIEQKRARAMGQWMAEARGTLMPPEGVDAAAINAVILAALHYLTLRARTTGRFAGVDLSSEAGRARIQTTLQALLKKGLTP
ncbi:MAG: TetR/AcrR family transcriptional regulator [Elstera sp.]